MERIVLGYDDSPAAASALEWVAARAATRPARVDIVTVDSQDSGEHPTPPERLTDAVEILHWRAPDAKVEVHRFEGEDADTLSAYSEGADLLVIGIHPGHPLKALLAGALPLRISARVRVPVVMVPSAWVARAGFVTVGVADDGRSDAAVAFAAREADAASLALRLVHSWLMPTPSFSGSSALIASPEMVMADHAEVLEGAVTWVAERYRSMPLQPELVRDSRAGALLRFAERSSLLVIGSRGAGLPTARLLGSVAQEVLWRAGCPVATVPPAHLPEGKQR